MLRKNEQSFSEFVLWIKSSDCQSFQEVFLQQKLHSFFFQVSPRTNTDCFQMQIKSTPACFGKLFLNTYIWQVFGKLLQPDDRIEPILLKYVGFSVVVPAKITAMICFSSSTDCSFFRSDFIKSLSWQNCIGCLVSRTAQKVCFFWLSLNFESKSVKTYSFTLPCASWIYDFSLE